MRAHVIENGIIANTIEVASLDVLPGLIEATEGGIGWEYSNGVFTPPAGPTLEERRRELQVANKQACENFILSKYPLTIQSSASLGLYPPAFVDAMKNHIARCINEENRIFDLLAAAVDPSAVEAPIWPEV